MPVTKSASKRVRQNLKAYKRNLNLKRRMKSEIRSLIATIAKGESRKIQEQLATVHSSVDKAAKAGVIHKNKAARTKSRLAKMTSAKPSAKPAAKTPSKKTVAAKPTKKSPAKAPKPAKS